MLNRWLHHLRYHPKVPRRRFDQVTTFSGSTTLVVDAKVLMHDHRGDDYVNMTTSRLRWGRWNVSVTADIVFTSSTHTSSPIPHLHPGLPFRPTPYWLMPLMIPTHHQAYAVQLV
jgi:hypothetical protein